MNRKNSRITALFEDDRLAADAIRAIQNAGWRISDVHGPIPSHEISGALGIKKSGVGWFTLGGGVIGFFLGYFLAVFTAARWGLMVSGKPVLAYIPFFIVGFEFTILFAVLGNVLGLILLIKLPAYRDLPHIAPECSADRFGVVVDCGGSDKDEARRFLTNLGAEVPESSNRETES
ncbi:MAG: DUF3341 domain-containing protein [Desulfosalsimonas sp.]